MGPPKLVRLSRVSREGMVAKSFKGKEVTPGGRKEDGAVKGGALRFEDKSQGLTQPN